MSKALLQALIDARKVIESPENWAQNWYAKDSRGNHVGVHHESACKFCVRGAVQKVLTLDSPMEHSVTDLLEAFLPVGCNSLAIYNDQPYRKHEEVLALFDKSIDYLKDITTDG